jgi:hypothetical protein
MVLYSQKVQMALGNIISSVIKIFLRFACNKTKLCDVAKFPPMIMSSSIKRLYHATISEYHAHTVELSDVRFDFRYSIRFNHKYRVLSIKIIENAGVSILLQLEQ